METKLTTRILNALGLERKSAEDRPDFGKTGYTTSPLNDSFRFTGWGWNRTRLGSTIDYAAEVGPLDGSSLVMAIVNWTGINLAEALPVVFKPDDKGVMQIELQHPAADLIRRPNPFSIWADECLAGALSWWIDGNWYMKKVRDQTGALTELWYLPHFLVEPRWPGDGRNPEVPMSEVEPDNTFLTHYQFNTPGRPPELIKRRDMLHIKRGKNLSNPRKGVGAFDSVLEEIYGDNAVARFSATIMKNMGMVQYLLSPKEKDTSLSPEEARHVKESWIMSTTGDNANTPVVNAIPLDVTKLSFDPKELDLKEMRKVPESRVAAVTGIPAIVLQYLVGLEHGHYGAAYEQARQQGYESVIIPIQNHISEDLTWQVLPEIDKTKGAKLTFDISKIRVLQEDRDNLFTRECAALSAGGKTLNMFLTAIGKDTVEGGDVFYVPSTCTPMTLETLIERANTIAQPIAPVAPVEVPAKMSEMVDIDRTIAYLGEQMKEFSANDTQNKAVEEAVQGKRVNIGYKLKNVEGMEPDSVVQISVSRPGG